jgi:hypothetical protein
MRDVFISRSVLKVKKSLNAGDVATPHSFTSEPSNYSSMLDAKLAYSVDRAFLNNH